MKISHRLYLTMTPAIIGVVLMVGLAYYGQYARQAPYLVLIVGAFVVIASVAVTWSNARFVAGRIERLADGHVPTTFVAGHLTLRGVASAVAPGAVNTAPDELDQIASVVDRLSSAVEVAETGRVEREQAFEERARDYARLLASLADASTRQLEEVRLPLHILLENHFGELNENQEEMLAAARVAADAADADMRTLRQMAELDLGEQTLRRDRLKPAEIIEALRPMLIAAAESVRVTLEFVIGPLLPALTGDRARLQDALVTIFRAAIGAATPDTSVVLEAEREGQALRFLVRSAGVIPLSVKWAAAVRVVQVHGGSVSRSSTGVSIVLPIEGAK